MQVAGGAGASGRLAAAGQVLLGGQGLGLLAAGCQLGLSIRHEAGAQRSRIEAGQGLQAVLGFDDSVLRSKVLQNGGPLGGSGVAGRLFRQVLHRAVVVSGGQAVLLQILVVDAAGQQIRVRLLRLVAGSHPRRLPQQFQRLRVALLPVIQPRHLVVDFVAILFVFRVFEQLGKVLVQPGFVSVVEVRNLAQHQLREEIQLVGRVLLQNLIQLSVRLFVVALLLIQLGQNVARARLLVFGLNQRNGLFQLLNGLSRLPDLHVVVGAGQKQLLGIGLAAFFLVQQIRNRLGVFQLFGSHERAHQPDQGLVLGVGVLADAVDVLKRLGRVLILHLIVAALADDDVGIIGPVGGRAVLNR